MSTTLSPVRVVQRSLGELLRSTVAGEDAGERGLQIWGNPGERWFDPTDPIWRVHKDAAMFPGHLWTHRAYGPRPLSDADAETYVAQTGLSARLLGVPGPSGSVAELHAMLESYRPELELTTPPPRRPSTSCCGRRRCPGRPGPATGCSPPAGSRCCPTGRVTSSARACRSPSAGRRSAPPPA
ncbi:MAG TPA: DUF2236 domain-containing protein [Propionibacterium sp.]|nr:DUF2236 domain-containing protein [Propionibacterium sp.]